MQRIQFKETKRQAAEIIRTEGNTEKAEELINKHFEHMQEEENKFKNSKVKIIDENEKMSKIVFTNDEDVEFLRNYYNVVYANRPEMTKEEADVEKDYDYHIDLNKYNPWDEYKQIYSGVYKKGKIHWLLRKMPEWKFLQIGTPNTYEDIATNPRNRLRNNMDDSIFSAMQTERYFDERLEKGGTFKGKSTAVRI